jgi:hypothetical protein
MALAQQHHDLMGDFKPRGAMAGQQVLDELRRANDVVGAKANPEEAAAFRAWLMGAAKAAAEAAKEAGSWGSEPSWSARASVTCSSNSARPSASIRPESDGLTGAPFAIPCVLL